MKILLSLVISIILCVSTFASDFVIKKGVLTKYNGTSATVTIPSGITSIGQGALFGCSNLKSISIPDSVMFIGKGAFIGCKNLKKIKVPKDLDISKTEYSKDCKIERY